MTDLFCLLLEKLEPSHILLIMVVGMGAYLILQLKNRKGEIRQTDKLISNLTDQINKLMSKILLMKEPDISGLENKVDKLDHSSTGLTTTLDRVNTETRMLMDHLSGTVSDVKFFDNNHDAFRHLINLHEESKAYIKATRYSQKSIQTVHEYWDVVRKYALDSSTVYKRITSIRSVEALDSVCDMILELRDAEDFQLGLTTDIEFMELLIFDGKKAVQCFHKDDFVIYSALSLSHEVPLIGVELVGRFESMFDLMWQYADMIIDIKRDVKGSKEVAIETTEKIREYFLPRIEIIADKKTA